MNGLRRLAALLAADAGDGGGGGSIVTETETKADGADKSTVTEPVKGEGEAKGEAKGEGDKKAAPADEAAKATAAKAEQEKLEKAAAALELKLPKGLDGKDPSVAAFKKLAAESGLDSTKAQKLFDAHHAGLAEAEKKWGEARDKGGAEWLANTRKEWRAALQNDVEFGGSKFSATKASISRVYNKYGASDPELKKFLNDGAGDNPALGKFLARIGRDMAEDTAASKSKATVAKPSADAEFQKLFDKSPELFT